MPEVAQEAPALPLSVPPSARLLARPSNIARSVFHFGSGVVALGLIELLPTRTWLSIAAATFVVAAWSMEIARRGRPEVNARLMRFFGPVAHPEERHRVNSSTWYVTALLLLALFSPMRAAELGVVVLAVADPAAGFIGRRFGRTQLRAGRSLEGTLAFVVVGALVAAAWLVLSSGMHGSTALILALAAASSGAIAELASTRLDDNFTIPIAAAVSVAGAQALLAL